MGERDAFGREMGEDSLQDMGWRADLSGSQPSKPPTVQWQPPKPEPPRTDERPGAASAPAMGSAAAGGGAHWPAVRMPRVRPRRRRGFARLIFMLALLVVVAASATSVLRAGKDAIERAIPTTTAPKPGGSLLRAGDLGKALDQLPKGQLKSLRVTATEINAQVISHGKMSVVRVTADGQQSTVRTPVSIPGKAVRVDPQAPARIVRAAHKRLVDVDYLVITGVAGTPRWLAYFKDGTSYTANATGHKVHRTP